MSIGCANFKWAVNLLQPSSFIQAWEWLCIKYRQGYKREASFNNSIIPNFDDGLKVEVLMGQAENYNGLLRSYVTNSCPHSIVL